MQPEPLVFEGQAHRSVTFQLESHDVVYTQGRDGLFRGAWPDVFGVAGPGQLKGVRGGRTLALYDLLQRQEQSALLLPACSDFLRGRTPLPKGPLTAETLAVFVDDLLEQGDGGAIALRRFLAAEGDLQRVELFARMLLKPAHRQKLKPWLLAQGEALSRFEEITRMTSFDHARYLLDNALRCEPLFQRVREVHVDLTHQLMNNGRAEQWLKLMGTGGWVPSVRVVCWRAGKVLQQFAGEPTSF